MVESTAILLPGAIIASQPQSRTVGAGVVIAGLLAILWRSWGRWRNYQDRVSSHHDSCQSYEKELQSFQLAKEKHQNHVAELTTQRGIASYQQQAVVKILESTVAPNAAEKDIKEGRTEAYFLTFLRDYFGGKIKIKEGFKKPGSKRPTTPDFIYHDTEINLYIDIEIDEPYTFDYESKPKKLLPIHCTDQDDDEARNKYFLERGWIIIRFSEEQVVRWPHSCCKCIAIEIAKLSGTVSSSSFNDIENLQPLVRWNAATAIEMANNRVRGNYLKLIDHLLDK